MIREELAALVQGSDEWKRARCGSLGASRIAEATARTKAGWGASRANLMAELIAERMTCVPYETYTNAAMMWGTQTEPDARTAYEFMFDCEVKQVGMIPHPKIAGAHCSPDGLIGDVGLMEIKCPQTATHLDTLLGAAIDGKYIKQAQWQMACCDRSWVDFVSYDPRLPETMRLFVKRIHRDNALIDALEKEVLAFLAELEAKLTALRERYGKGA